MYAVVEFLKADDDEESNNDVAIVPLIWLTKQERRCYWPNRIGKTTFEDFVKNQSPYKSTWPTYKVFKVHFKSESYEDADDFIREMLREGNDGSTTGESEKSFSRKKLTFESSCSKGDESVKQNVSNASLPSTVTICSSPSPTSSVKSSASATEQIILSELAKIGSVVDQQSIILHELLRNSRSQMIATAEPTRPSDVPSFPITTMGDFTTFDARLKTDEPLKRYMISRLASVGGSGIESLTRRILKFLITDEVASSFNYRGRGEKQPFSNTQLMSVVLEATKQNFPAGEKNDLLVTKTTQDWLKYANSRLKNTKP